MAAREPELRNAGMVASDPTLTKLRSTVERASKAPLYPGRGEIRLVQVYAGGDEAYVFDLDSVGHGCPCAAVVRTAGNPQCRVRTEIPAGLRHRGSEFGLHHADGRACCWCRAPIARRGFGPLPRHRSFAQEGAADERLVGAQPVRAASELRRRSTPCWPTISPGRCCRCSKPSAS